MGFLMTLMSFTLDSAAVMLYLCSSCTISPANRLNVRGILVAGFTSISTFCAVRMNTCSRPALLRGESNSISRHWWVISGRAEEKSRLFRERIPWDQP